MVQVQVQVQGPGITRAMPAHLHGRLLMRRPLSSHGALLQLTPQPAGFALGSASPWSCRGCLVLSRPDERVAIRAGIGMVLECLAEGRTNPRRAGQLLFCLQVADDNDWKPIRRRTGGCSEVDQQDPETIAAITMIHSMASSPSPLPSQRTGAGIRSQRSRWRTGIKNRQFPPDTQEAPAETPFHYVGDRNASTPTCSPKYCP